MQRDILLLTEMIDAAEQAQQLTMGITVGQLETDRQRRDALLWNFTVLGEAAGQLSAEIKDKFPDMLWQQPIGLRNRIVHGYWSIDLEVLHNHRHRATTRLHSQSAHCPGQHHRQRLTGSGDLVASGVSRDIEICPEAVTVSAR
jgi:uncharacterized protein with HEPN domain